ncbi:PilZ domain-containing protein [Thalassolituus sp. LLYu03]|uniref:PilZ domain-containing protein n=1 Tax=Thalassolituus sp. LLYu03 TaxID=3421656 RepID=UPI003D276518
MHANERRFRQRYDASPLKMEIRRISWLGRPGKSEPAIARDFALGGVAILTPHKFKPGKRLLVSIESRDHRLQAIPATVLRCEQQGSDFVCALKFAMGQLPETASRGAYTVLQRLEGTLKAASAV